MEVLRQSTEQKGHKTVFSCCFLPLFGSHLLGNKSKISGGAIFMGAAGQKRQFPPRAYMGVQTSALL